MLVLAIVIVFFLLLIAGMPVSFVLGLIGLGGMLFVEGSFAALDSAAMIAWSSMDSFTLTAIPLFVFMGQIALRAGFSEELFSAISAWFGRVRGGLGCATILACGIFAAVSGSTAAACATMGILAAPEMKKQKYDDKLTFGTLAAGGSLAILIPPSIILIVYGSFTGQSIGKLFLAGFIPGAILIFLFLLVIAIWTRTDPESSSASESGLTLKEKIVATKGIWNFIILMVVCLGSIYVGIATPTEAAGLGASGSLLLALFGKRLSWKGLFESLLDTVKVTCMVLFLILGGLILSNLLLFQDVPHKILSFTFSLGLPNWSILCLIYLIYLLMGCFLDGITMMIISLPIVAPLVTELGYSLLWFGIAMVILVELSQLTPPVGMNLYIIRNVTKGKIVEIVLGSLPFIVAMAVCLVVITVFPDLVLYLPNLVMK